MTPLLTTRGLCRNFGGLKAVDNVDFAVVKGEIRAIIGPNGAGKTTFVSLLCGRTTASDGTILFNGEDVTRLPAHRRVQRGMAYTFQITNVFHHKTAEDNVRIAVESLVRREEHRLLDREAATFEALDAVGLASEARVPAGQLAYGHQRLLEIAMGLALRPKLLILDEPTQGLSDADIERFEILVRQIAGTATVLLIEHNMPVVMSLAHRITVLESGRVLAEGTPDAIRDNAQVQSAYLGM
ncbi:ABC transporter ATP-binding protein [Rhizobium sp. SSA_523]|uniref:ABC transporter ATP-binding protein n=1 Tax=Rhizobium sp. SSA_523 TaxID=2952477 RepID=UPI00208FFC90|nr:ABC transporter ATP-binding protein [Rhizobium sp. SSA_523]MCO5732233.1 ABC transporter ATP-binding protein [Rhizobium sp. SSA_523]WKC22520.1 ABC transporter ATP-binding protein [Rhizobium sp. SSA_523]